MEHGVHKMEIQDKLNQKIFSHLITKFGLETTRWFSDADLYYVQREKYKMRNQKLRI